jgi:UDP-N-acetylmuramate dehydrogenase
MLIQEFIPVGSKTTMRIGGKARYYADILTKEDVEEAVRFAKEKSIPLIPLGGGSNTIFADEDIDALVIRIKADQVMVRRAHHDTVTPSSTRGDSVTIEAGKIMGSLLNELAAKNLDLSALTGIPGTIGGAIFGNAGQGPKGIWIDTYVESVTAFVDGAWKTFSKEECDFRYRESKFKDMTSTPVIWEVTLNVPSRPEAEVKAEIERLLKKRIETQPHLKTAGSCFKALPDGTPAWQLIEKAGLRGTKVGGVQVSEKHANFLLNVEKGTFMDAVQMTKLIREKVPQIAGIEMRFYDAKGHLAA